jgi:hypothetical protein
MVDEMTVLLERQNTEILRLRERVKELDTRILTAYRILLGPDFPPAGWDWETEYKELYGRVKEACRTLRPIGEENDAKI